MDQGYFVEDMAEKKKKKKAENPKWIKNSRILELAMWNGSLVRSPSDPHDNTRRSRRWKCKVNSRITA